MESPLGMQFNEFDADKDGRLNDAEAYQLLKLLGKNVYQGTVRQVIITSCRLSNTWIILTPKTKPSLSTSLRSISTLSKHSSSIKYGSINTKFCTALQSWRKNEHKDKEAQLHLGRDLEGKKKTLLKAAYQSKWAHRIWLIRLQSNTKLRRRSRKKQSLSWR